MAAAKFCRRRFCNPLILTKIGGMEKILYYSGVSNFSQVSIIQKRGLSDGNSGTYGETGSMGNKSSADQSLGLHGHDELYEGHIPTSFFQKGLLAIGSSAMALIAPWRDDMIATMGETSGYQALKFMKKRMQADPTGQHILDERPRINSGTVDLQALSFLPEGTFGRLYSDWLRDNKAHPDARLPVHFVDDPDLAYVMTRYREIHDLIHTILAMPTHMLGEVVVKWVEGLQFRLPLGLTGGLFGALRLRPKQQQLYIQTHLGYAWNVGLRSDFLLNVFYEDHWETPVEALRKQLKIPQPPDTPVKLWKNS